MSACLPPTLGLVLAGGLARRMGGGDKARIAIGGITILQRVLACLTPQCAGLLINANGDPARFADTHLPVVADSVPNFAGPLAGILAGLDWAAAHAKQCEWLVSVPGDCPFLPSDLVVRLHAARVAADTRWSVYGRSRCVRTCATRSSMKARARSKSGPHATASPLPIGLPSRSIRSSTSTRRKTRRERKRSRPGFQNFSRAKTHRTESRLSRRAR